MAHPSAAYQDQSSRLLQLRHVAACHLTIAMDIFFQILSNLLKINISEKVFFVLILSSQTSQEASGYLTQYFAKAKELEFEKHIHMNDLSVLDLVICLLHLLCHLLAFLNQLLPVTK